MSKTFQLIEDLHTCYRAKAPTVESYLKLSERERKNICGDIRQTLVKYVNSSEYTFNDILKDFYDNEACKIKFLNNYISK
jgi:hypothetical protein